MTRTAPAGLSKADDPDVVAYAVRCGLVIVTHDRGMRRRSGRGGCRVVCIYSPESTARRRLIDGYQAMVALLGAGEVLVDIPAKGPPR